MQVIYNNFGCSNSDRVLWKLQGELQDSELLVAGLQPTGLIKLQSLEATEAGSEHVYNMQYKSNVKGAYEQQVKGTKFPVLVVQNLDDVYDGTFQFQNKEVKKNSV